MASSNLCRSDAGFATPAAVYIGLAISIIVIAVTIRSTQALLEARRTLERKRMSFLLDGVGLEATVTVIHARGGGPFLWTLAEPSDHVEILAEPEGAKLSVGKVLTLNDDAFAKLGAETPASARNKLVGLAVSRHAQIRDVTLADASPTWRACAASAISEFGASQTLDLKRPDAPVQAPVLNWRIAEMWRLRIRDEAGWTDDRVVRFTGDPQRPSAIVRRHFYRDFSSKGGACPLARSAAPGH